MTVTKTTTTQTRHDSKVHLTDVEDRPPIFRSWERVRHRRAQWFVECVAEMFGVFFYCYAGVGATAAFIVGGILELEGAGSILNVGFAYALGIVVALVVCSATSGGHFSPAITVVHVLFNGFPIAQGARYIVSQIFGAFAACMFVYWQWRTLIKDAEATLLAVNKYEAVNFSNLGPAGIFAFFSNPADPIGLVFLNELVSDFFIGIAISACMDPTNFFAPPAAAPWVIGLTYGTAIWGFSPNGLAANTARDVGGRLAAIAIWGTKANGGKYAAISALTNILATLLAYSFYEFVLKDSSRVVTLIGKEFRDGHAAHIEHRTYHFGHHRDGAMGFGSSLDSEKGGSERSNNET